MTVYRKFNCDLCQKQIWATKSDDIHGIGIIWSLKYKESTSEEIIEQTSVNNSEHHLCFECITNIKNLQIK
jgi:hypothetical protein